jgi:4-hydroxy 2-oxovalerate aldolase
MKLTDCTIRDGGHINNWKFDELKVQASYHAACVAKTDYFETGYRQPTHMAGLGKFAYCEDSYISDLIEPGYSKLIVMIDTGKARIDDFNYADKSPFWGVRVAAYPNELKLALVQAEILLSMGYHVWVNPMASIYLTEEHLSLLAKWRYREKIEALYLADSFGAFLPHQIHTFMEKFRDRGYSSIGFHAHNNLQLAVANTLEAVFSEATHVDATIYGMGRGAGNAPIEIMTSLLPGYDNTPYLSLINTHYKEAPSWGAHPEYVLSGITRVHPYYAKTVLKYLPYVSAQEFLKKTTLPISYSESAVIEALKEYKA